MYMARALNTQNRKQATRKITLTGTDLKVMSFGLKTTFVLFVICLLNLSSIFVKSIKEIKSHTVMVKSSLKAVNKMVKRKANWPLIQFDSLVWMNSSSTKLYKFKRDNTALRHEHSNAAYTGSGNNLSKHPSYEALNALLIARKHATATTWNSPALIWHA